MQEEPPPEAPFADKMAYYDPGVPSPRVIHIQRRNAGRRTDASGA